MDTGKVPGEIGKIPKLREVIGTPPGGIWALLGLSGEREGRLGQAARPSPSSLNWAREGGRRPPFLLPSPPSFPPPSRTRKGESYS